MSKELLIKLDEEGFIKGIMSQKQIEPEAIVKLILGMILILKTLEDKKQYKRWISILMEAAYSDASVEIAMFGRLPDKDPD